VSKEDYIPHVVAELNFKNISRIFIINHNRLQLVNDFGRWIASWTASANIFIRLDSPTVYWGVDDLIINVHFPNHTID
jgi:hypothetical protein